MTAAQQIEDAWQLLEDGAALQELRASWNRLTQIRRELDTAVLELARRIEQLRIEAEAQKAAAKKDATRKAAEQPKAAAKDAG